MLLLCLYVDFYSISWEIDRAFSRLSRHATIELERYTSVETYFATSFPLSSIKKIARRKKADINIFPLE
jgi:hypothetical protein